jgi:hypothetical protein
VKTTIEIPDALFRQAKAAAAEQGRSLKEFFTEAVHAQLRRKAGPAPGGKPWESAFGGLKDLHRENLRIQKLIDTEFETLDEEEWR